MYQHALHLDIITKTKKRVSKAHFDKNINKALSKIMDKPCKNVPKSIKTCLIKNVPVFWRSTLKVQCMKTTL